MWSASLVIHRRGTLDELATAVGIFPTLAEGMEGTARGLTSERCSCQESRAGWSLIWTLMDPVSCVSCVSGMCWLYAAETHETFPWESGMRYQSAIRPDLSSDRALSLPADGGLGPLPGPL